MTSNAGAPLTKLKAEVAPTEMGCPVCSSSRQEVFQARLLRKYDVRYFHCASCGLLQTEKPYWFEEAYKSAIADADTGIRSRNIEIATKLGALLYFCFDRNAVYVDFAGGYGLLTRKMRDRGFDFRWHDPYCQNIFARGFEWSRNRQNATVAAMSAFEMLEHVADPLSFIQNSFAETKTKTIGFSTLLYEGAPPRPVDWWYYVLDEGQHISFYRRDTLQAIANKLGLRFHSHGSIHMFPDSAVSEFRFRACTSRLARLAESYISRRMPSRTTDDQHAHRV